jgi:hypothetical protein
MKKRILFTVKTGFLLLFVLSLLATLLQFAGKSNPLTRFNQKPPIFNRVESFDPMLARLNSVQKLEQYCDSVYSERILIDNTTNFERTYTDVVSEVVRKRFYHGYSTYGYNDNYLASAIAGVTVPGLSSLVIPDEIMKYPYAACSQQAMIEMQALEDKGFKTRKILFHGKTYGGHFAFEVFYEGAWHFHDPNMEPDKALLASYGMPNIDFLAHHPDLLTKAYNRFPKDQVMDIIPNYSYGPVNTFPAKKAMVFHKATKFLSYTIWLFFLAGFIVTGRAYRRVKSKRAVHAMAPVRQLKPAATAIYFTEYNVQGK